MSFRPVAFLLILLLGLILLLLGQLGRSGRSYGAPPRTGDGARRRE